MKRVIAFFLVNLSMLFELRLSLFRVRTSFLLKFHYLTSTYMVSCSFKSVALLDVSLLRTAMSFDPRMTQGLTGSKSSQRIPL